MYGFGRNQRRRAKGSVQQTEPLEVRIVPSVISVTTTPGPRRSVNLTITGTSGDDDVQVYVGEDNRVHVFGRPDGSNVPAVSLNGAPAQHELLFAKLHDITMNLGSGNDVGYIGDVSARRIVINDGLTADESNVYTVTSLNNAIQIGSIQANFDLGIVNLSITSSHSMRLGSLAVSLARTNASHVQIFTSDSANLQIVGLFSIDSPADSGSEDRLIYYASSSGTADSTDVRFGNVRWRLGGGNDQIYLVGSMTFEGQTKIDSGSGDDSVQFSGAFATFGGCPVFTGRVIVKTGAGDDVFGTNSGEGSTNGVNFFSPVTIVTGAQPDYVFSSGASFFSSLTVDLGDTTEAVADKFWCSDIQVTGKTVIRSSGLAQVLLDSQTATSRFHGNASFTVGSGFIYVGSNNESTKLIFGGYQRFRGLFQLLDVYYFADVEADFAKRSFINAVLR